MTDDSNRKQDEPDLAVAMPTKSFFVDMLVRDIDLKAAILDLIDNCVDGILRSKGRDPDSPKPYAGFQADIVVGEAGFSIRDNCGGIPIAIARNSAFAIGRPTTVPGHAAAGTVGMYGVGMKRALFKFGKRSVVTSFNDEPLQVEIDPDWLSSSVWEPLEIKHPADAALKRGTTQIVVTELVPLVAAEFRVPEFRTELANRIAEHFMLVIQKGFAVTIRGTEEDAVPEPIKPRAFELLGPPAGRPQEGVVPHVWKGTIGSVSVELFGGLYRPLLSEDEIEGEEWAPASAAESGWIVACNDRVVIWKDRTRLTGWGEATVPNWHGQFLAFVGFIQLRADDPDDLPLTTTKQGIDASSTVWSLAKDMMRETTKQFTNLTNKWKASSEERTEIFADVERISLSDLRARELPMRAWHKLATVQRFAPTLPSPKVVRTEARVSFAAPKAEIVDLALAYFDDASVDAHSVGREAFRREYNRLPLAAE